jgi:glycosyltransferase involved in cell wall biosynthesis
MQRVLREAQVNAALEELMDPLKSHASRRPDTYSSPHKELAESAVRERRADGEWSQCRIVVQIRPRSETLDFRPYAEATGEVSVLEWAITRLSGSTDGASVAILTGAGEQDRVRKALGMDRDVAVIAATGSGEMRDLERLAASVTEPRLLICDLTAALLPSAVLRELVQCHVINRNHATVLTDVPCSIAPALVESSFLIELVRGDVPGMPSALRPVLDSLARALKASPAGADGVRIQQLRIIPVESKDPKQQWPLEVGLQDAEDVAILRRALALQGDANTEILHHFPDAAAAERTARLAQWPRAQRANRACPRSVRRILFAQVPSAITGVEQVVHDLAKNLSSAKHPWYECAALVGASGMFSACLRDAGVDVIVAERNFGINLVEHYLFCRDVLARLRPDIVHAHAMVGAPFLCATVESAVPFVQHVHVAQPEALQQLQDQIANASAVVAVSEFVRRQIARLGIEPAKVSVVRNAIVPPPRSAIPPNEVRRMCDVSPGASLVLMVARFAAKKRHDVALEAFSLARQRRPKMCLVFAGEVFQGDESVLENAKRITARLGISSAVRFVGFWRDMNSLYGAADILLLPAEDEALPLTVLEAMAAGLPVVAARSGGTPEMIDDRDTGALVEPGDCRGFSERIEEMLLDGELRNRTQSAALLRCINEFTVTRFISDMTRIYERLWE